MKPNQFQISTQQNDPETQLAGLNRPYKQPIHTPKQSLPKRRSCENISDYIKNTTSQKLEEKLAHFCSKTPPAESIKHLSSLSLQQIKALAFKQKFSFVSSPEIIYRTAQILQQQDTQNFQSIQDALSNENINSKKISLNPSSHKKNASCESFYNVQESVKTKTRVIREFNNRDKISLKEQLFAKRSNGSGAKTIQSRFAYETGGRRKLRELIQWLQNENLKLQGIPELKLHQVIEYKQQLLSVYMDSIVKDTSKECSEKGLALKLVWDLFVDLMQKVINLLLNKLSQDEKENLEDNLSTHKNYQAMLERLSAENQTLKQEKTMKNKFQENLIYHIRQKRREIEKLHHTTKMLNFKINEFKDMYTDLQNEHIDLQMSTKDINYQLAEFLVERKKAINREKSRQIKITQSKKQLKKEVKAQLEKEDPKAIKILERQLEFNFCTKGDAELDRELDEFGLRISSDIDGKPFDVEDEIGFLDKSTSMINFQHNPKDQSIGVCTLDFYRLDILRHKYIQVNEILPQKEISKADAEMQTSPTLSLNSLVVYERICPAIVLKREVSKEEPNWKPNTSQTGRKFYSSGKTKPSKAKADDETTEPKRSHQPKAVKEMPRQSVVKNKVIELPSRTRTAKAHRIVGKAANEKISPKPLTGQAKRKKNIIKGEEEEALQRNKSNSNSSNDGFNVDFEDLREIGTQQQTKAKARLQSLGNDSSQSEMSPIRVVTGFVNQQGVRFQEDVQEREKVENMSFKHTKSILKSDAESQKILDTPVRNDQPSLNNTERLIGDELLSKPTDLVSLIPSIARFSLANDDDTFDFATLQPMQKTPQVQKPQQKSNKILKSVKGLALQNPSSKVVTQRLVEEEEENPVLVVQPDVIDEAKFNFVQFCKDKDKDTLPLHRPRSIVMEQLDTSIKWVESLFQETSLVPRSIGSEKSDKNSYKGLLKHISNIYQLALSKLSKKTAPFSIPDLILESFTLEYGNINSSIMRIKISGFVKMLSTTWYQHKALETFVMFCGFRNSASLFEDNHYSLASEMEFILSFRLYSNLNCCHNTWSMENAYTTSTKVKTFVQSLLKEYMGSTKSEAILAEVFELVTSQPDKNNKHSDEHDFKINLEEVIHLIITKILKERAQFEDSYGQLLACAGIPSKDVISFDIFQFLLRCQLVSSNSYMLIVKQFADACDEKMNSKKCMSMSLFSYFAFRHQFPNLYQIHQVIMRVLEVRWESLTDVETYFQIQNLVHWRRDKEYIQEELEHSNKFTAVEGKLLDYMEKRFEDGVTGDSANPASPLRMTTLLYDLIMFEVLDGQAQKLLLMTLGDDLGALFGSTLLKQENVYGYGRGPKSRGATKYFS